MDPEVERILRQFDDKLYAYGEQLRMLTSIAIGRKVYETEDVHLVNNELMAQYAKLPDLTGGPGLVDMLRRLNG